VAYDVFRLPFVFAKEWGIASVVPPMNLFKVFPRFGAMILGQPVEQTTYTLAADLVGWTYHFSNGLTFGIMYLAMIGDATLFAREDYVEEAWRIVDPVLKAGTPVYDYEPGSWGPREVEQRVSPVGGWHNPTVAG